MRREFLLPEDDREYLATIEGNGCIWETIKVNGAQWLILNNWPLPKGYSQDIVSVALLIPHNYPDGQIDMAYFYPWLHTLSGRGINAANACQALDGKEWQRWSRHRSAQNPWRPGVDNLSTHLTQVRHWLERELAKG